MRTISIRTGLLACLLCLFATAAPAQNLSGTLDEVLRQRHEARLFNGSVLVAKGDEVLFEKGYGEANMEWHIPNAPDTRFRIGSVTKQFTAALVLQLVEEGLLDLEGRITDYLPEYPKAQGDRVTIHQLLTHTSGIPSYTGLPNFRTELMRDPYAPDSFLSVFSRLPLEFEPGAEWRYNNSGYFLLGAIVERVAGAPYDRLLRERLLRPLGLSDTGYDHFGEIIERRAAGYARTPRGYENAPYLDTSLPYAAGMMYATVRDLFAWTRALHAGRPFRSAETLQRMTTPVMQNYAYGVIVRDVPAGARTVRVVHHGGGINGFAADLYYLPEDEYTIAVLDNTGANVGQVTDAILRVLYDLPVAEPKRPVADVVAEVIEAEGVEQAVARYRTLKTEQPDAYEFGEQELNRLGYYYLNKGDTETAIRIFQLNVEVFPEAANPYDSLGEAYLAAGDRAQAAASYRKSLELNPANENARQVLRRLGEEVADAELFVPAEVLESYVGRYQLAPTFVITVTREGEQLFAQATGQPRFEIFPMAENKFFLKVVDAQITFNLGPEGTVESLTLHQNGRDQPAQKVE